MALVVRIWARIHLATMRRLELPTPQVSEIRRSALAVCPFQVATCLPERI